MSSLGSRVVLENRERLLPAHERYLASIRHGAHRLIA